MENDVTRTLIAVVALLCALGCTPESPTDADKPLLEIDPDCVAERNILAERAKDPSPQPELEKGILEQELERLHRIHKLEPMPHLIHACPRDCALPEVSFTIGDVRVRTGDEVRVPVWIDTQDRPTNGGLLFVDLVRLHVNGPFPDVIPGPMWSGPNAFVSATTYAPSAVEVNMLILGWADVQDGYTVPIQPEALSEPLFWFVFEADRMPGLGSVTWRLVADEILNSTWPDEGQPFPWQRRGEMLVDRCPECYTHPRGGSTWNLIDFWRSRPNSTGLIDVYPGRVIVTGRPELTQ